MRYFRDVRIEVVEKGDAGPVTVADRETETFLKGQLLALTPNAAWIGEESPDDRRQSDSAWIVDPIDGTRAFTEHDPNWCISVAYAVNGVVVIGIVYAPALNRIYTCLKGQGPKRNFKKFNVNPRKPFPWAQIGANSEMLRRGRFDFAKDLHVRSIRSCALAMCEVASGGLDACMVESPHLGQWDVAAGLLIIEEAGGKVRGLGEFERLAIGTDQLRNVGHMIAVANGSHLYPLLKHFTDFRPPKATKSRARINTGKL